MNHVKGSYIVTYAIYGWKALQVSYVVKMLCILENQYFVNFFSDFTYSPIYTKANKLAYIYTCIIAHICYSNCFMHNLKVAPGNPSFIPSVGL